MNNDKRKVLRSITKTLCASAGFACLPDQWQRPIMKTVILPAHAQTSACSMAGVAGTWDLLVSDVGLIVELYGDGTGAGGDADLKWELDGADIKILLILSAGLETFSGTLDATCEFISGTVGNSFSTRDFTGIKLFL